MSRTRARTTGTRRRALRSARTTGSSSGRRARTRKPRFVMAYKPNLRAGLADAILDDPTRSPGMAERIADRRRRTRVDARHDLDASTNTVYFGTGSGHAGLLPGPASRDQPAHGSLIAVDLRDGRMKWWRQLLPSNNQWEYDVAQPPLVYTTRIGGQRRRVVSVATKEGTWFAFDAATGRPFHQRVKVIDRVEHPPLKPGQPVTIFPDRSAASITRPRRTTRGRTTSSTRRRRRRACSFRIA